MFIRSGKTVKIEGLGALLGYNLESHELIFFFFSLCCDDAFIDSCCLAAHWRRLYYYIGGGSQNVRLIRVFRCEVVCFSESVNIFF